MLNSFLEKTLYSQAVQPVFIEIDLGRFSATLGQIAGLFSKGNILKPILQDANSDFGLAALLPVSPEIIKKVNNLPGVKMVHANLQARALEYRVIRKNPTRLPDQKPAQVDLIEAKSPATIPGQAPAKADYEVQEKNPERGGTLNPSRLYELRPGEPTTAGPAPSPTPMPQSPPVSTEPSPDWWPTSLSRTLLEAEKAFIAGYTGESIKVGVADTGVDFNHPQLRGVEYYSTMQLPAREIFDENGHGSHVASTIGGKQVSTPVQISAEGVSRARLVCCKCLGRFIGTGLNSEIANAMSLLYNKGCRIISMSLGSDSPQGSIEEDPLCRMVKTLTEKGCIMVIAAGNSGPDDNTIGSPGCSPDALTVAAINKDGTVADFSSRGGNKFPGKPDVAGPGVLIYSGTSTISPMAIEQPQAGYGYVAISGTSMATPHISGLIALLRQKFPELTTQQVKDIMSHKGGIWNPYTGFGVPKWSYFN